VAYGLIRVMMPWRPGAETGGAWIALLGGLLLLDHLQIASLGESWPVLVILAGLLVVFRAVGWLPSHPCLRAGARQWNEVSR
jgi:hypothetical protein